MSEDESELPSNDTTDEGRGSLERRSPLAGGSKKGCGGKWRKDKQKSKSHSPRPAVKDIEQKLVVQ